MLYNENLHSKELQHLQSISFRFSLCTLPYFVQHTARRISSCFAKVWALRFRCVSVYRSPWGLLFIVFGKDACLYTQIHTHTKTSVN